MSRRGNVKNVGNRGDAAPSSSLSSRSGPSGAWSRLKPANMDPLDEYGLPSKGEKSLHDYKIQETYFGRIIDRYMKFCASSAGPHGLEDAFKSLHTKVSPPIRIPGVRLQLGSEEAKVEGPTSRPSDRSISVDVPNDVAIILLAMRKLREGILGSRRRDIFAQRAYMFIIHASILSKHWESYQPALSYLLYEIHHSTPLSVPELQEFSGYRILDLACRQYELVEALTVRHNFGQRDRKVLAVLRSLVQDDWVHFWRTRRAVDGYQRAIMEFAVDRTRLHVLKCIGRGYLNVDKSFLERVTDTTWSELLESGVGWQLQENENIVIRKPKAK